MIPSITQDAINTALGNFLQAILPVGVKIIVGQVNRVASPEGDYCVMWPLRRPRLGTNLGSSADAKFTGSITGSVMTITEVVAGTMNVGATIFGVNVVANTTVTNQIDGTPGGDGTYTISPSQTVGSTTLSAGATIIEQSTEIVMQVDVHGGASGDNAETISTLFRDAYGVSLFDGTGITPLYADDPRQMPFTTAAAQYEDRWTVDLHMDCAPAVSVPQQFFDAADLAVVDVDVAYPD